MEKTTSLSRILTVALCSTKPRTTSHRLVQISGEMYGATTTSS